jgi:hypothetical protein
LEIIKSDLGHYDSRAANELRKRTEKGKRALSWKKTKKVTKERYFEGEEGELVVLSCTCGRAD